MDPNSLPVDVHYLQMESWLENRRAALRKRAPEEYDLLRENAPKLVQLARFQLPSLRQAVSKAEKAVKDTATRIEAAKSRAAKAEHQRVELLEHLGISPQLSGVTLQRALSDRTASAARRFEHELRETVQSSFVTVTMKYCEAVSPSSIKLCELVPALERWLSTDGLPAVSAPHEQKQIDSGSTEVAAELDIDWGDGEDEPATALVTATSSVEADRLAVIDDLTSLRGFLLERVYTQRESASRHAPLPTDKLPAGCDFSALPECECDGAWASRVRVEFALIRGIDDAICRLEESAEVTLLTMHQSHSALEAFLLRVEELSAVVGQTMSSGPLLARLSSAEAHLSDSSAQLVDTIARTVALRDESELALRCMFAPREAFIVGDITTL